MAGEDRSKKPDRELLAVVPTTLPLARPPHDPKIRRKWIIGLSATAVLAIAYERGVAWSDMKPNIILACLAWAVALAAVLVLFWTVPWSSHLPRWLKLGIAVCTPFVLIFVLRPWVVASYQSQHPPKITTAQRISQNSYVAAARQWRPPELPKAAEHIRIHFGGMNETHTMSEYALGDKRESFYGLPNGDIAFTSYVQSNRFYLEASTPLGEGREAVRMNNEFAAGISEGWDRNFDAVGFEMVDNNALPVMQVQYETPTNITIYGILVGSNGSIVVSFGNKTATLPADSRNRLESILTNFSRKAWFKYPSTNHPGERNAK